MTRQPPQELPRHVARRVQVEGEIVDALALWDEDDVSRAAQPGLNCCYSMICYFNAFVSKKVKP